MKSSSPRSALTGVPSGARIEAGTPKKARKYSEAVSKSIILRESTPRYWHDGPYGEARSTDPFVARARRPDVLHRHRQGDRPVDLRRAAAGPPSGAARSDQGLYGGVRFRRAGPDGHGVRGDQAIRSQP